MPKLRLFGATKILFSTDDSTLAPTVTSPAFGRSRPAIERSVVVLPQPLGPSSVKSCPWGTSKLTSCAARTISPRSFGYSVWRPSTFSTRLLLHAELAAQPLRGHDQHEEREDEQHAERRELHVLPV